jgi:hypothetical protein
VVATLKSGCPVIDTLNVLALGNPTSASRRGGRPQVTVVGADDYSWRFLRRMFRRRRAGRPGDIASLEILLVHTPSRKLVTGRHTEISARPAQRVPYRARIKPLTAYACPLRGPAFAA